MTLRLSTCAILLVMIVSLLAGCGMPIAPPTPVPVVAKLTVFLPTATLTPVPPTATLTPMLPTATLTSLPPTATPTPLPPTDTPPPPTVVAGEVVASLQERISAPGAARSDLRELAAGNNAFAFDLYQAISDGEDNLLFSPYSISMALAMVYAGARGRTEQQMADTLHFELPQESLHPAFNALDLELDTRSHAVVGDASGDEVEQVAFELHIANAIWGQAGYPFLPEYLDLLALNYGAGIRLADFRTNAPAAVVAINQWVSEQTNGRIRDIVDSLGKDTSLVLANTVYFNAAWAVPFDEEDTKDEPFHLLDGKYEIVAMMHQRDDFRYTEGRGYQAIQLPYTNRKVGMVILLPGAGQLQEMEERLAGDWVQSVVASFSEQEVVLSMPKFGFETPVLNFVNTLSAMGMPDAVSPASADFSGITQPDSGPSLYISRVLHKAFINVDDQRTEAAAATIIKMPPGMVRGTPTEPPPIIMRIDRPFIFLIRDIETDTILFIGRVMNPNE